MNCMGTRVPQWVKAGKIMVSGFHSPLEQQVLRSLLRHQGRAVKVLARSFSGQCADYRPPPEEREPLTSGHLLVISAFAPTVHRATALQRNRLVLALAIERVIPYIAADSPLAKFLDEKDS